MGRLIYTGGGVVLLLKDGRICCVDKDEMQKIIEKLENKGFQWTQ